MKVTLLNSPSVEVCGIASALCTGSDDPQKSLESAIENGHGSVVEHCSFSFLVEGISRACMAQFTRHRIASFSVQSQRYVSMDDGFEFVIPPSIIDLGPEKVELYRGQMLCMHQWYRFWKQELGGKRSANEDARFVLPNAAATSMVVSMNARELMHFFSLRCCNRAQWEIRAVANRMLLICRNYAPELFEKAGAPCTVGKGCQEKKMSCGQWKRYGGEKNER